ncbi:MAG: DUF3843 family protein [Mariniphaga sp.]|nr:DUF3843 family protein [Mariniphaga sp.]
MKNKIYIKQWLELKPYNKPTVTDSYYLKLSNEIKNSFFYDENMLVYRLDKNETDFYAARNLIDTLLFKTWLFFPDTLRELRLKDEEIIERAGNDENLLSYLNDTRDGFLHTAHTRLMSMKGKDWMAKILGENHPQSSAFSSMSQRVQGYFLYKGQNKEVIFLEHIASGKKFELAKKSFDHSAKLVKPNTIVFIGLVNWMDEWWFSGVYVQNEYNAELVNDEKKSVQSRAQVNFLDHEKYDAQKDLQKQMETFKKFNNGSQIAFMPTGEIESFTQAFLDYFNNAMAKTSREKEEAFERMR